MYTELNNSAPVDNLRQSRGWKVHFTCHENITGNLYLSVCHEQNIYKLPDKESHVDIICETLIEVLGTRVTLLQVLEKSSPSAEYHICTLGAACISRKTLHCFWIAPFKSNFSSKFSPSSLMVFSSTLTSTLSSASLVSFLVTAQVYIPWSVKFTSIICKVS